MYDNNENFSSRNNHHLTPTLLRCLPNVRTIAMRNTNFLIMSDFQAFLAPIRDMQLDLVESIRPIISLDAFCELIQAVSSVFMRKGTLTLTRLVICEYYTHLQSLNGASNIGWKCKGPDSQGPSYEHQLGDQDQQRPLSCARTEITDDSLCKRQGSLYVVSSNFYIQRCFLCLSQGTEMTFRFCSYLISLVALRSGLGSTLR